MSSPQAMEALARTRKPRQKGQKNKFTALKDQFLNAFETIGGEKELASWAKDKRNRPAFYGMIAKMLPSKTDTELSGEININIKREIRS